jgi:hypothetical protein
LTTRICNGGRVDRRRLPYADRDELAHFVDALFRYADEGGFIQLRAFRDDINGAWIPQQWPTVRINGLGLEPLVDAAYRFAGRCAAATEKVVFAPPIATFKTPRAAAEKDIDNGLTLSVECDENAAQARQLLEGVIGPATLIVASGGMWTHPITGEVLPKLHLHWRLTEPTREFQDHVKLKEARRLAKILTGADGTAVPLVHPLRWPGSWHRKTKPRMARIVGGNPDAEIDLAEAYEKLSEAAAATAGTAENGETRHKASSQPHADALDVTAALAVIPNDNVPWDEWTKVGLATWRATGGSEVGFAAWAAWSAKSCKNDPATTRERWEHFAKSPPDRIGSGTLFYLASQARPGWHKPSSFNSSAATNSGAASTDLAPNTQCQGSNGHDTDAGRPWPVMAVDAYCGLAGEIVRAIQPHTEADPVAVLIQVLASAGNAIGRGPYYQVEGDRHGPNIYAILVGETAKGRKGTSGGRVRQIMEVADPQWVSERVHGGLSSGEGMIWAVRDAIIQWERQGKGAAAERVEVVVDPGVTDKRLYVLESEFSGALAVMKREGNTLSRVIRDAWDRGDLATLTKNSPARATGAHMSIVGHITADELRHDLDRTSMGNGYANRFLFACVRRANVLPFGGALDEETICELGRRMRAAIEAARNIVRVTMTSSARGGWRNVYSALSEGEPGLLGAIIGRAEAQVIRLALIYALLDRCAEIDIAHLRAALAVWEFCETSVRYIFGDALGDPIADEILRALRQAGDAGMTRTQIRDLFGRNRGVERIEVALSSLARHRKANMISRDTGGRPAEVWVATIGVE